MNQHPFEEVMQMLPILETCPYDIDTWRRLADVRRTIAQDEHVASLRERLDAFVLSLKSCVPTAVHAWSVAFLGDEHSSSLIASLRSFDHVRLATAVIGFYAPIWKIMRASPRRALQYVAMIGKDAFHALPKRVRDDMIDVLSRDLRVAVKSAQYVGHDDRFIVAALSHPRRAHLYLQSIGEDGASRISSEMLDQIKAFARQD
jgi:hypothetical protein